MLPEKEIDNNGVKVCANNVFHFLVTPIAEPKQLINFI
jgi:hypothetical protein